MDYKKTLNDYVFIKLDPENKSIRLRNGCELFVDTTYEPEKHATVEGEVWGLPSHLSYTGTPNKGMPWKTRMELRYGDKVIIYYLAVVNALKKENSRYIIEGKDRYIFVPYQNIYAVIREGKVIPVNGYVLFEQVEDPSITRDRERMKALGLELVTLNTRTNTHVIYGKIKYTGEPNQEYVDENYSDEGVDVKEGDVVVMRKISDIPLQYDLHSKIDGGAKYFRVQRKAILAKI